jgi:hypothetical protein
MGEPSLVEEYEVKGRVYVAQWVLDFDDRGVLVGVSWPSTLTGVTNRMWRRMCDRINDDVRDHRIPGDPDMWATEWVEVDGRVGSYLWLVWQSVMAGLDDRTWRGVLDAQLRPRLLVG